MDDIKIIASKNKFDTECEPFMEAFQGVVDDVKSSIDDSMPKFKAHIEEVLHYLVPNGKKMRGLIVPVAYRIFVKEENITPENMKLCYIMGWMIQIGHAVDLLIDDIMDKSETRRGISCWHTRKDVGLYGVNDAYFMEQAIYFLLYKHCSNHPALLKIYELLHDVGWKTGSGQALDCLFTKEGNPDLSLFTMENYKKLARYKTAFYTFCGPVAVAMYLANITDESQHKKVRLILLEIGEVFQIQDDYFDCFGEMEDGTGEDIREGKCTWMAVKALEKANPEERKLMEKYYGTAEPEAVEVVRNLYEKLDMVKMYAHHERESFNKILSLVQLVSEELPAELFFVLIRKIYKRNF